MVCRDRIVWSNLEAVAFSLASLGVGAMVLVWDGGLGVGELSPALGIIFAVGNFSVLGIGLYVASGFLVARGVLEGWGVS